MLHPKAKVVTATDEDIVKFYGVEFRTQWALKAMRKGDLVAGLGGALEIEPGVWFAFLELPAHVRRPSVYRHIRETFAKAKEMGAIIIKAHCTTDIPRARQLMERLGFVETDEIMNGKAVWNVRL